MFAIGEDRKEVAKGKIVMPTKYKLRKKKIYGLWVGKYMLYISDEMPPLKNKGGGMIFDVRVDSNHCLHVPEEYNGWRVLIRGCISTIQLVFEESEEKSV